MLENAEMRFADAEAMGLSHDEWLLILKRLNRTPNLCELGIFSAMWSEHCCLLYTSPSPRDGLLSRMPSSA